MKDLLIVLVVALVAYLLCKNTKAQNALQTATSGSGKMLTSSPPNTPGSYSLPAGTVNNGSGGVVVLNANSDSSGFDDITGPYDPVLSGSYTV